MKSFVSNRRRAALWAWVPIVTLLVGGCGSSSARLPGRAEHVVIVIMDGLRPDTVTDEQMPTLAALARSGTFFANHHAVYPSSTQVNGVALATGQLPATSNIVANREYRPDVELLQPVDTNDPFAVWKGDQIYPEGWLRSPTLPELARGKGLKTVVAGTKAVVMLWDRSYRGRTIDQPTLFEGRAIPAATLDPIIAAQGPFPLGLDWKRHVNSARDEWTVRALTEQLWGRGVPALTVLWLYEPDFSQHGTGVGSKNAKLAYKSSDDRLATVLATLEKKGVREKTDVIVVSDHGCSTISRKVDVADELRKKGKFKAEGDFTRPVEKGDIVVTGLGGSVSFYVGGGDEETRRKLVAFLQSTDWAGVIFTKEGGDGTFKFADAGIDSPDAPDVIVSLRWKDEVSEYGTRGTVVCDGMDKGQGMHVSLSRYDMTNTLIAAGPDFRKGFVARLPSDTADVAPTLARILGIAATKPMDGRVLSEAFAGGEGPDGRPETSTLRADRKLGEKTWSQYLRRTAFAGRTYVDEGNFGPPPAD